MNKCLHKEEKKKPDIKNNFTNQILVSRTGTTRDNIRNKDFPRTLYVKFLYIDYMLTDLFTYTGIASLRDSLRNRTIQRSETSPVSLYKIPGFFRKDHTVYSGG